MSDSLVITMIVVGIISILFLLLYIVKKYRFINTARKTMHQEALRLEEMSNQKQQYVVDSLKVLSQALCEGQVGVVEGSIRINALLGYIDTSLSEHESFIVFSEISHATEHIPILQAWKSLDKASKRKHEKFMETLEKDKGEEARIAAEKLKSHLALQP